MVRCILVLITIPRKIRPRIDTPPVKGHFLSMYFPLIAPFGVLNPRPTLLWYLSTRLESFTMGAPLGPTFGFLYPGTVGCFWNALSFCSDIADGQFFVWSNDNQKVRGQGAKDHTWEEKDADEKWRTEEESKCTRGRSLVYKWRHLLRVSFLSFAPLFFSSAVGVRR